MFSSFALRSAQCLVALTLLQLAAPIPLQSNPLGWWLRRDVDVITVTDVTEAGKAHPPATPAQPVYYKIIDLGQEDFGRAWAGERVPHFRTARAWLMKALARQGYLLADEQHPPTQLLVFSWGMTSQGAFDFMGGDRMPPPLPGWFAPPIGIWAKVIALSSDDVFLGLVKAFTIESETAPQVTLLWQTRFGCAANGLGMMEALPLMIEVASPNFGRETLLPVNVNASERFRGRVDLGELKVLGEAEMPPKSSATTNPEKPRNEPAK